MIQFKALLIKEYKEAFRDKRALMVALMMAAMAPVMIMVMSKVLIKELVDTPPIYIKYSGSEYAPKLVQHLKKENILSFEDIPAEDKAVWHERNIEVIFPETFAEDLLAGTTIKVILRADYNEKSTSGPIRRLQFAIRDYSLAIGYKRLLVRGVDIRLLQAVNLVEQDTAIPSSNFMLISMMLGLYILMAAFMSGLPVAIDSSAGERERNVLEMLLCQPVSTLKIVLAKLCSATTISLIGVLLVIVLTSVTIGFVDLSKIGATFKIDVFMVLVLVILLLPICFFASALQLFLSFQAKSFKEAQSTANVVIAVPAMIPIALTFIDDRPQWLDWLPISGQALVMEDLFKGVPIHWGAIAVTGFVTLAITAIFVLTLSAKLKSEKVVMSLS